MMNWSILPSIKGGESPGSYATYHGLIKFPSAFEPPTQRDNKNDISLMDVFVSQEYGNDRNLQF